MDALWGGLALLATFLGFSAGELDALADAPREARPQRVAPTDQAPALAPEVTPPGEARERPAPARDPLVLEAPIAAPPVAGAASPDRAPSFFEERPFFKDERPQPKVQVALAPLAEELVQALIRTRTRSDHAPLFLVQSLRARAQVRPALLLALLAYFPEFECWPNDLAGTRSFVLARHAYYLQDPSDAPRLALLQRAIGLTEPGVLDPSWLVSLARAHAESGTFDSDLARLAPREAAALFAAREGGLTTWQRRGVAGGLAARRPRQGAALALDYFAETWDPALLALARRHDPAAAASFERQRRADPCLVSAQTLLDLEASRDRALDSERLQDWYLHLALAERSWRRVLPKQRDQVLDLLEWERAWTPLQERIAADLLGSGDEDQASSAFWYSPVRLRLAALTRGTLSLASVRDLLEEDLVSRPFATEDGFHLFLSLVPRLEPERALQIAAVLQIQGAPDAARQVLDRVPPHASLTEAKLTLARGESLARFLEARDE